MFHYVSDLKADMLSCRAALIQYLDPYDRSYVNMCSAQIRTDYVRGKIDRVDFRRVVDQFTQDVCAKHGITGKLNTRVVRRWIIAGKL